MAREVVYQGRLVECDPPDPNTPDGVRRVLEVVREDRSVERLGPRRKAGADWLGWGTPLRGTTELAWAVLVDLRREEANDAVLFSLERWFASLDPAAEWELEERHLRRWVAAEEQEVADQLEAEARLPEAGEGEP